MRQNDKIYHLAYCGLFAALAYVAFAYLKIPVTLPGGGHTYFHIGNAFAALGALLLGGFSGGLSAGIGMALGDILAGDPIYAVTTVFLKLVIGLVTGFFADHVFKIGSLRQEKKVLLFAGIACAASLGFNVVLDPFVGFLRNRYLFGIPTDLSYIIQKLTVWVTFANAVASMIVSVALYKVLRPALKKARLYPQHSKRGIYE